MATYEEMMAKSRELAAAGDIDRARQLAEIALRARQGAPQKQLGQILRENIFGDNDDTTQNTGEKIGTFLNKAGEAMTFGLVGDEASAAVAGAIPGGRGYQDRLDYERGQEEILERENPGVALGAEIAGGVAGAMTPMGAVGSLSKGSGLMKRIAASVAAGAGMGGTYGFMEGDDGDRAQSALDGAKWGAAGGAAAIPIAAGVRRVANVGARNRAVRRAAQNAPTTEELRALGNAGYQAVEDAGVQVSPGSFARRHQRIVDALRNNTGFDELPGPGSLTPKAARVNQIMTQASEEMAQDPTSALPFRSLDQMRRQAGAAAASMDKTDSRAGMEIINELDDYVRNLGPGDVVAGDVDALQTALPKARETWARMSRSQMIDDALANENNYRSGGSSAIANQFARILRNPGAMRGFSEAEKEVMQRVVRGTVPERLLNYAGSGLGMMGQVAGGAALGGGLLGGLIGTGTAIASRAGSEALTRRNAEIARAVVANGGLKQIPQAPDSVRKVTEALSRRIGAVQSH